METVQVGEWAETTHNDTEVRIRVKRYRVSETVEKQGGGTEEASGGKRFVIAEVEIGSSPGDKVSVGRGQWTLIDWTGECHNHAGVTSDVEDPFPGEDVLHNDTVEGTVVWEVEYHDEPKFEAEPYGDQSGGTVRVVEG